MLLFRRLIAVAALLLAANLHAQSTMSIDGSCNFQLATSGTSVSINPANGNVTVSSQSGSVNCGGTPASVTLTLPTSAQTTSSFIVSWTSNGTSGANPCTPSGGGGSNWAAQGALPATGNRTITAPASAANNVPFTITCTTAGSPVNDTKTMDFTGGGGGAFVDLMTPISVAVSNQFTVSWTSSGTSGATPCTPSGGGTSNWASQGALEPTGNRTITAPSAPGSAVFSISCATGSTPVNDSETVSFTAITDCSGVTMPPGISPGSIQNWGTLYPGGFNFPQPFQVTANVPLTAGAARVFRIVPQLQAQPSQNLGRLVFETFQNSNVVASISPCPNDFRQSVLNNATQKCYEPASEGIGLAWKLNAPSPLFCNLTPGQTYYFNVHVGSGSTPDSTGAFCANATCIYSGGTQAGFATESPTNAED